MKLLGILLSTVLLSSSAFGSMLIQCELEGDLRLQKSHTLNVSDYNSSKFVALFDIKSAENKGSHLASACTDMVGTTAIFNVDNYKNFTKQKTAKVSYRFLSTFGTKGIVSSTLYTILNEETFQDASQVENINGYINLMPRLRPDDRRLTPIRSSLINLNLTATVTSNGCTDASNFNTKITQDSNGVQKLSIQRIKTDVCSMKQHDIQLKLGVGGFNPTKKHELLYDNETLPVKVETVH